MKFHAHVLNLTRKFLELKLVHLQYRITWLYSLMKFLFCEWLRQILFVIVQLFYFYFFPHVWLVLYVCTINSHELCYFYNYFIGGKNSIMFFQEKMHWYNWYWNEVNYYNHCSITSLSEVMLITCILNASILWLVLHVISCDILNLFILIAESALALLRHRNYWISGYSSVSLIY